MEIFTSFVRACDICPKFDDKFHVTELYEYTRSRESRFIPILETFSFCYGLGANERTIA